MPINEDQNCTYEKYLKLFDLHDNQYIIGIYQKGVTIHNQQIRALNIFYCLHKLEKIQKDTSIAIIGGGFAGITFAAAALNCKLSVSLFEQHGLLLPLQTGCNRIIHPNIYNFPAEGSEKPDTDLPVLNWKAAPAFEVASKVKEEFEAIGKELYGKRQIPYDAYYSQFLSSGKIRSIVRDGDKYLITDTKSNLASCDIIIYAVGFGIEKSQYSPTNSYWSSTKLIQENVAGEKLLISGLGDGAFTDVITSQIRDFDYQKLIDHFKSDPKRAKILIWLSDLRDDFFKQVKESTSTGVPVPLDFISKRFENMYDAYCTGFFDDIPMKSYSVILHGKRKKEEMFQLDKASLLNSFLVFILIKTGKVTYKCGEAIPDDKTRKFRIKGDKNDHLDYDKYIRHGTNKNDIINDIKDLGEKISKAGLKDHQEASIHDGDIQPLWKDRKEYEAIFQSAWYRDIPKITGNSLQTLESYTNYLALAINQLAPNSKFRLTLHKVFEENSSVYFQQVTAYAGTERDQLHGGYGRVFNWKTGSIGYSIVHQQPLIIIKKGNETEFAEKVKHLNLEVADRIMINSHIKSFLSVPILCLDQIHQESGITSTKTRTNFVLYIDSEDGALFDKFGVLDSVLSHTERFVENYRSMVEKGEIINLENSILQHKFSISDIECYQQVGSGKLFGDGNKAYEGFKEKFEKNKDGMVFEKYYSLSWPTS